MLKGHNLVHNFSENRTKLLKIPEHRYLEKDTRQNEHAESNLSNLLKLLKELVGFLLGKNFGGGRKRQKTVLFLKKGYCFYCSFVFVLKILWRQRCFKGAKKWHLRKGTPAPTAESQVSIKQ